MTSSQWIIKSICHVTVYIYLGIPAEGVYLGGDYMRDGTNSAQYDFRSVSIQILVTVYMRPVQTQTGTTSDRSPYKSLLLFTWDQYELRPVRLQISLHTNPCYCLHETGMNSNRYDFRSVSIQTLVTVYMRPVWTQTGMTSDWSPYKSLFTVYMRPVWTQTGTTSNRSPYKSLLLFTWDRYELRLVRLQIGLHTNPCYCLHETGMNNWYDFRLVSIQILVTVYMRPVWTQTGTTSDLHTNRCYCLHETGTNSDRYNFRLVSIQILVTVYMRPVQTQTGTTSDRSPYKSLLLFTWDWFEKAPQTGLTDSGSWTDTNESDQSEVRPFQQFFPCNRKLTRTGLRFFAFSYFSCPFLSFSH